MIKLAKTCPCGSTRTFLSCCQPIITNDSAKTAEQLMRSRYSAFVLKNAEYILKTWHPDTRPNDFSLTTSHWLGLKIITYTENTVSFEAAFHSANNVLILLETSRFVCIDKHWRYIDGDCSTRPIKRNDKCFCGSHKKYKLCCKNKSLHEV